MSLEALQEWNSGPFDFSGFGWDYAGGVMASEGSKIAESSYGMRLDLPYDEENMKNYEDLLGDIVFSSDDQKTEGAQIFLSTITYYPPFEG